jgi:hypothetical protein
LPLRSAACTLKLKHNQTMKTLLFAVIVSSLTTVSTLAGTELIISRGGESFEMQGWVLGYDGGFVCKQPNINYELISYDFRNRVKVLLSATGNNEFALRLAMLKQRLSTITGNWQRSAECQYLEVASVQSDDP